MTDTTPVPGSTPAKDWLMPLTYIIPIVFIYTMMKKGSDSNYIWHAKNGAGAVVIGIALNILFRVLWSVLGTSLGFIFMIFNLVNLVFGILMIYGAWQSWQGKLPNLPVITKVGQMLPLEKWFHGSTAPAASPAPAASNTQAAPTEPTPPTPPAAPQA